MALFKEVRSLQIIPSYLVQPLKANCSTHLAMSQMSLLARLLKDLGTGTTGFTIDNVMKVSAPLVPWAAVSTLEMGLECGECLINVS